MRGRTAAISIAVAVAAAYAAGAALSAPSGAPPIPREAADPSNAFAMGMYRELSAANPGKNVFFSPPSMYVAFAALYEGAEGETARQMQGVFGFDPDRDPRRAAMAQTMSSINRHDPHAELSMANSLWIAEWLSPHESYLEAVRGAYLAGAETTSFPDPGKDRVNAWASEKTRGRIAEVLRDGDTDGSTAMVLANAVYFKGTWASRFPPEDTRESGFWGAPGADLMRVTGAFNYTQSAGAQVLELPYEGGRISMLLVLPEERGGLPALEGSLTAGQVGAWMGELVEANVEVAIPKLEARTRYMLAEHLSDMGMPDAFDPKRADLGGVAPEDAGRRLYVGSATHDAYVMLDERGTEAAAVTAIVTHIVSLPPPPVRFTADHPFVFMIYDRESGMILFMGRVSDPAAG